MPVQYKDPDSLDSSKNAVAILDYIFDETNEETIAVVSEAKADLTPIRAELKKEPVVKVVSSRSQSRVLFVTREIATLEGSSLARLHYKNLADIFDEVHVLVLTESWQSKRGVERIDKNIWFYTTSVQFWWMQPFVSLRIAHAQLQFADGFRPDIVVALDPFESGVCALLIARKYARAFQVHILEDYYAPEFKLKDTQNRWRLKMASYVLNRAQSVRTATVSLKQITEKKYRRIKDISLLPRHYDIASLMEVSETPKTVDAFSQYTFVVLFVGKLDQDSTLFRALDACRAILNSQRIGLVVVGNGPTKSESEKRAEILGIKEQIIFETDETKALSYMKLADILLCTDTTEASDEIIIKAAASGLPLLMAETPMRTDLFVDGESAFLVQKEDTIGFSQKLTKFLNTNALRTQFKTNALDVVKTRLHEDPHAYREVYKNAIEGVFDQKAKIN